MEALVEVAMEQKWAFKPLEVWQTIKENWVFLAVMSIVITLIYLNSLNGDFVSDDYATILHNPDIATWKYAFTSGGTTYFIHAMIAKIFGVFPLPYHLFNTVLYIATCWLAFVFIDNLFGKKVAMVTMIIFAVHPIHVEAVSWISGKGYLIIAFYTFVSMLALIKYSETKKWLYLWVAIGSFILNFLNDKPRPFSLFLIIALYLLVRKVDLKNNRIFKMWPYFIGLAIVGVILAWPYIIARISVVNGGYNASESIFYNPFFQYPTGVSKYLQMLWFPTDLTLYHTMYTFPVWLNWAILLTYIVATIYFFFKNRPYFFALAFIMAGVLPSIMPVKVSWLVAERYMFLGSLGWCLFVGLILVDIGRRYKLLMPILLGVVVAYSSVRVVMRNSDWQTNHKLWVNTCQVSPNSHNAWNNIGDDYDKLGQYENSIKGFTQSTVVKPNYADAFHNRANIFYKIGRLDLARDSYNTALSYSPALYQTYLSLVQIDLTEKKLDLALEHAQAALKIQPNNPQAGYVLAIVLSQSGQNDKAKLLLEEILRMYPGYTLAEDALKQMKLFESGSGNSL
jgi:hypothetical protein